VSLLSNAIESIRIGVEDYQNVDPHRSLSALRNILAGILLLYKEKLCRLSPAHDNELLIKKDIRPSKDADGNLIFEGKGKITVDVHAIKERFSSLKVSVDWPRFYEINQLRNNIEHYYTDKPPDAVREVVAKSFILIRDFIVEELEQDPKDLIGAKVWNILLKVAEVYTAEELACSASLSAVDWRFPSVEEALRELRCQKCHSALIKAMDGSFQYPRVNLACSSCGHEFLFETVVAQCIGDYLAGEAYVAAKDGGEPPYATCPSCAQPTFIIKEGCCVACDYEIEYTYCQLCESRLSLDEQWLEGNCTYCNYKWEKLMEE